VRPDRNPLRRACDRAEAGLLAALLAAFFVAVSLAAIIGGVRAYGSGLRVERAEQPARHPVPPVLAGTRDRGSDRYKVGVPATWTAPDGTLRSGRIVAPPGTEAVHTVTLWVGASGHPAGRPLQAADVIGRALVTAMFIAVIAAAAAGSALPCAAVLARWVLFSRRLAAWDAEWRAVGPPWASLR
jgi:hypothetical protein